MHHSLLYASHAQHIQLSICTHFMKKFCLRLQMIIWPNNNRSFLFNWILFQRMHACQIMMHISKACIFSLWNTTQKSFSNKYPLAKQFYQYKRKWKIIKSKNWRVPLFFKSTSKPPYTVLSRGTIIHKFYQPGS